MQPGPLISPRVNVLPASIRTEGDTFQPLPSSRDAPLPVPSVAIPALPFSPVKFSGLIDRDCAFETRQRLPRLRTRPLNAESAARAFVAQYPRNKGIRTRR